MLGLCLGWALRCEIGGIACAKRAFGIEFILFFIRGNSETDGGFIAVYAGFRGVVGWGGVAIAFISMSLTP